MEEILRAVQEVLESTPPELAGDVLSSGIVLTGGVSQLTGLTDRLGGLHRRGMPAGGGSGNLCRPRHRHGAEICRLPFGGRLRHWAVFLPAVRFHEYQLSYAMVRAGLVRPAK